MPVAIGHFYVETVGMGIELKVDRKIIPFEGDVLQLLNSVPNLDLFKLSLERKPNEGRALWEAILELKYVDRYGEYHGGKFDIIGYGRYALLTDGTIVKDSRYFNEGDKVRDLEGKVFTIEGFILGGEDWETSNNFTLLVDEEGVKSVREFDYFTSFIEIGENNGVKLYSRRFTKIEEES